MKILEVPFHSPIYQKQKELRQKVLRDPLGMILSDADTAGEEAQYHFAAMDGDRVVGNLIVKPLSASRIKLRQMAVDPDLQKAGVGRELVRYVEDWAEERDFQEIEFNARAAVLGFYQKLGYSVVGDEFLEVSIPHFKMEKVL